MAVAVTLHLFQDFSYGGGHFRGMRRIAVGGVAPGAPEVAVVYPDKRGGISRLSPFAFHRLEYFHQRQGDLLPVHRDISIHSRRRIPALVGVSSSRSSSSRSACSGVPNSFSPSSSC